jgi:hypothetical protein
MQAYKVEATVEPDGSLRLCELPFHAGQRVEVIVLPAYPAGEPGRYPLRGTPYRFENPTEPVADRDWEVAG